MRPDWTEIVAALTSRNVSVSIITNGFLFTEDIIARLKALNIESVAVSLDGPRDIHDKFRQAGSFDRAVNAIDTLSRNGILVSVITTLHSLNETRLEELYNVLREKNIFAWQIQACSPMGNASNGSMSTAIDFASVIKFVEEHLGKSHFAIGIADNIGYYTETEGYLRGSLRGNSSFNGCSAGLDSIGIDSVGNVKGCEALYHDSFIEGNLRERSLLSIWDDPNAFAYNRQFTLDRLSGKCRNCKYGSKCAGGCRSYNYFSHGKLYESPACVQKSHKELQYKTLETEELK